MENLQNEINDLFGRMSRAELYDMISRAMFEETKAQPDPEKLKKAIEFMAISIQTTLESDPELGKRLYGSGIMRLYQYDQTGSDEDFNYAVEEIRRAVAVTPENSSNRRNMLDTLSYELQNKFEITSDFTYLQTLIDSAPMNEDRANWMHQFSVSLRNRYDRSSQTKYLDAAIRFIKGALDCARQDFDRTACLITRAMLLCRRYEATNNYNTLIEAIDYAREARESAGNNVLERNACINELAILLRHEFEETRDIRYINEAIYLCQSAIGTIPKRSALQAALIATLASLLEQRSENTDDFEDLKEAIKQSEFALNIISSENYQNPSMNILNNLANQRETLYSKTGDTRPLDESIRDLRSLCDSVTEGNVDRGMILDNLARLLALKYRRTGESELLEESIEASRSAVNETGSLSKYKTRRMSNLAMKLIDRFDRKPNDQDLNRSIQLLQDALSSKTGPSPTSASVRSNLALGLHKKFRFTNDLHYLKESLHEIKLAIKETPSNDAKLVLRQHNLAVGLRLLYVKTGDEDALNQSASTLESALEKLAANNEYRPMSLEALGNGYIAQFRINPAETNLRGRALKCFVEASQSPQVVPLNRIKAARQAIGILHEQHDWKRADELARKSLSLVPLVCGRYLNRNDQQNAMVNLSGLAADACSLSLKTGDIDGALQQLEFGRGLIQSYMMDNRNDLSQLKIDHPKLAEEYEELRFKATREIEPNLSLNSSLILKQRWEIGKRIEELLEKIREDPRYRRFLKEPTVEELRIFASEGPIIVVNVTDISSDAIIITETQSKLVSLPKLSPSTSPNHFQRSLNHYSLMRGEDDERDIPSEDDVTSIAEKSSSEYLSWLWENGIKPVLNELERIGIVGSGIEPPRVWWVGSGLATSFPFHAACEISNPVDTTESRVLSSYSPTIKSLSYVRSNSSRRATAKQGPSSILFITMPETPGQRPLKGVIREKEAVKRVLGKIYSWNPLNSPTADQVVDAVPRADIVHFACHGFADYLNPFESHLLFQKTVNNVAVTDKLKLSRLSAIVTSGRARVAFLSACSTAEIKFRKLEDEGLHLAGAFQVAGFVHVIGTLWKADDDVCSRLAELFYLELSQGGTVAEFSNKQVARALWKAIRQIRSEYPGNPAAWACFVHFGA